MRNRFPVLRTALCLIALAFVHDAWADQASPDPCTRPALVSEPRDLRSKDGVLELDLSIHDYKETDGSVRYCYLLPDGTESPTLRLHPGDLLILRLKDDLVDPDMTVPGAKLVSPKNSMPGMDMSLTKTGPDPCTRKAMSPVATNLHFHGLTVPPVCHQDDVLYTSVLPGDPPFEYRFRIPADEPPGLYWYHPHIHGYSSREVQGGASGALIVEGIERADPAVAGLPERVLVVRDMPLMHPDASPSKSEPVLPKMLVERDGDAANNGTGYGKPAKDLSLNFVPLPYPDYPPARIVMRPGEKELWRVLNAAAITYLNLAVLYRGEPQRLGIVAMDGVPFGYGNPSPPVQWVDHIGLPPGARVEFILEGPSAGMPALFVTRTVDTGPAGENDTNRALAVIEADKDTPAAPSVLPDHPTPLPQPKLSWVGDVTPVRVRKLYFSEAPQDPKDPNSPTIFYITVDGQKPKAFDPSSDVPDITVRQGEVEDWIIENRSNELHAFHIHQLHFEVVDWNGVPVHEPFLRDTVNVPYYRDTMLQYPSVRLRMDFRDPNIVGTFVYHCHILEHEDGGMMGTIQVLPASTDGAKTQVNTLSAPAATHVGTER